MRAINYSNSAMEIHSGHLNSKEVENLDRYSSCPVYKDVRFQLLNGVYIENRVLFTRFRSIKLSIAATKIIYKLKLANGDVVSKDELLSFAWGSERKVLNNVNVAISELRLALSDTSAEIITSRGVGFSLYIPIRDRGF